ncbi:MAG: hypothetical protein AB1810_01240 [Pseudomonadota bacterium]
MNWRACGLAAALIVVAADEAGAYEWSGMLAFDNRVFWEEPAFPEQRSQAYYPSLVMQPELRADWNGEKDRFTFIPFLRAEPADPQRQHLDIRELNWLHAAGDWDVTVGVAKVFWGVTESRHLVDIINQSDLLEDIDREQKLGQPMVNLNLIGEYGTFGFYVLPYFREQTYQDRRGRLRFALPIDTDRARYASAREEWHTDVALRWSHSLASWDIGVSYFRGTGRESAFDLDLGDPFNPRLVPRYDLIRQTGLELQHTSGPWLLKLEAISRAGQGKRFFAATAGFEYTWFDVLSRGADLGVLAECNHDGRDANPLVAPPVPYDDDVFLGLRLSMNDADDSSVLAGVLQDVDQDATFISLKANRRFATDWILEVKGRHFVDAPPDDFVLHGYRRDSHLQLRLARYF